jgi:arginine decarboxylase
MLNQQDAPLHAAMVGYKNKNAVRFHVPGHKGMGNDIFQKIYPYDVTEIPGLDDLHHAEEAILEAQQLAADAFGADETYFLVGGSTVGNIAMIMAACRPGEKILVQRNVHKSVIHGLILAQSYPVYLRPELDEATDLPLTVSVEELRRMLQLHSDAKAVFLSNPNYFGMGMKMHPYAELCREYGIPLLVDEAHGAHFGFHPDMPQTAMSAGASAAVQSTHKMLNSMTMSSMLHVKGSLLDRERLAQALNMLQSSSPSYPLMASLDLARRHIITYPTSEWERSLRLVRHFRVQIELLGLPWLQVIEGGRYDYLDPYKITLQTMASEWNGPRLKQFLEDFNIYPELADERHVLLALSVNTTAEDVEKTVHSLAALPRDFTPVQSVASTTIHFSKEVVLTPHQAFYRKTKVVPIEEAVGQISGEMIAPYPPGIPVLNPGERLENDLFLYLKRLKSLNYRFHGAQDLSLNTLKIIVPDE